MKVIHFVPQQEEWIVERFGKFKKTMSPVRALIDIIAQKWPQRFCAISTSGTHLLMYVYI